MTTVTDTDAEAWAAYVDNIGEEYADRDEFEEAFLGEWDSLQAYAEDYLESSGMLAGVDDTIARYFDYQSFARELELGGDIWTHRTPRYTVFVFANI